MSAERTEPEPMNSNGQNQPEPELPAIAGDAAPSHEAMEPSVSLPAGEGAAAQEFPAPVRPWVPEDLRVPWGWLDLVLLVAVALCAAFLTSMFLGGVFAAFHVGAAQIKNSPNEKDFFIVLNQILLSLALLGYLALNIRTRYGLPFWRTIGWRPLETGAIPRAVAYFGLVGGGVSLSVVVMFASSALSAKTKLPIEAFFEDRRTALLLMLTSILLAPVVEETIFRGYIYPVVARSFGVGASIMVTGTLFGALHAAQLWRGWWQIALLVIVGIIFTYARAVSRTVVASYLLHMSYNLLLSIMFIGTSHWLRSLPASF